MEPLWIFRHVDCEGPGYLAEVLDTHRIPWRLIAVDQGQPIPAAIDGCSGLVFMGGPMSVNDPLPWIEPELKLIRAAADAGKPVLGHCLGGQLISKALGGHVGPNPVREIGWHPVAHADTDAASDWLAGLPDRFEAFHWHGETFSLPPGAQRLLHNEHCAEQAFALDNILALQCHIEMTEELVREWVARYADELSAPSPSLQSPDQITADLPTRISALQQRADTVYRRWLQPVLSD
ncbi:MAG: type 1 glutamine amidotransferase [Gammaproteobacteria bacterium]